MSSANQTIAKQREQNSVQNYNVLMILDDILAGFGRNIPVILLLASIMASLAFFTVQSRYVPQYQVYETYIVTPNYSVNYNSASYERAALQQIIRSFPYVISNNAMQNMIAKDLGTGNVPGRITASSVEETNAFTITVTADNPQTAQKILKSVMTNYPTIAKDIIGDTTLTLLTSSGVPTHPINGESSRRAAMLGVIAVVAVFAAAFAASSVLRQTIRKEEDLKTSLNVRCLGSVPKAGFRKKKNEDDKRIRIDNKRISYSFKESIRTLRTRVERLQSEQDAKVFLISSAIAEKERVRFPSILHYHWPARENGSF